MARNPPATAPEAPPPPARRKRVDMLADSILAELDKHEAAVEKASPTVVVKQHAIRPFRQVVRAVPWTRRNTVIAVAGVVIFILLVLVKQIPIPPSEETRALMLQADMVPVATGVEDPRIAARLFALKMSSGWNPLHVFRSAHPDFWRRRGETDPNQVARRIEQAFLKIQAEWGNVMTAAVVDEPIQMTAFRNRDDQTVPGWIVPVTIEFDDSSTRRMTLLLVRSPRDNRGWDVWDLLLPPHLT